MGLWSSIAGLVLGDNPIKTITDGLVKAHADVLNSKTEQERIEATERLGTLTAAYKDIQDARASAKGLPKWISIPGGFITAAFAVHIVLICIGTFYAAPLNWQVGCRCYGDGAAGRWEFTRHIPALPDPVDKGEIALLSLLFGGGLIAMAVRRK